MEVVKRSFVKNLSAGAGGPNTGSSPPRFVSDALMRQ